MREVPADVRKRVSTQTKKNAMPIWRSELAERAPTRFQQRALVDSARVGVTARNVFLRSGAVGKLSSGTPVSRIAQAAEWGHSPSSKVEQRAKGGKRYERSLGSAVPSRRRGGWVVHPAANDSIPRFASLWIQIAHLSLFEAEESV